MDQIPLLSTKGSSNAGNNGGRTFWTTDDVGGFVRGGVDWVCTCYMSSVGGWGITSDAWTRVTSGVGSSCQTSKTSSMLEESHRLGIIKFT